MPSRPRNHIDASGGITSSPVSRLSRSTKTPYPRSTQNGLQRLGSTVNTNLAANSQAGHLPPVPNPMAAPLRFPHSEHHRVTQKQIANGQSNNTRSSKSSPTRPNHQEPRSPPVSSDWPFWPNLVVNVQRVSAQRLETSDYFNIFSQFGFVTGINCNKAGLPDQITFCPPPAKPFWERGSLTFVTGTERKSHHLHVWVALQRPKILPSPLNAKAHHLAIVNLYAHRLNFGVMITENTMMRMLEEDIYPNDEGTLFMQLNLLKLQTDIRFQYPVFHESENPDHGRIKINLRDLTEMSSIISEKSGRVALVFTLQTPPEFYRQVPHDEIILEQGNSRWTEWSSWSRQTELVFPDHEEEVETSPLRLRAEHAAIDYGRWLTYFLTFDNSSQYAEVLHCLSQYNIRINHISANDFNFISREDAKIWKHLELPSTHQQSLQRNFMSTMAEMESGLSHLPFPVLWQLMVCISRGYLNEYNMTPIFLQKLNDLGEDISRNMLESLADRKLRLFDPMEMFVVIKPNSSPPKRILPYTSLLYSCSITPTTIYFSSPVVEVSNRVVRKFSKYQDRFLRVRFVEENSGRIHSQHDSSNEEMFVRIRRFLKYGLIFGDRHYEFLAFGNSQFREHGLFAFASIKGLAEISDMNASDIRSQLGDFSKIRTPAKWCARLGQNFSTTRSFGTSVTVKNIPDICRNGFTFSDGVGNMSCLVAKMVGMEFGRSADDPPSVVQFRLGGCKGILAIVPDKQVQGCEIWIRPSQRKFESKSNRDGLEIIRISQFVSATLNRQLILVLSSLGVGDGVFRTMLQNMLIDLEVAMTNSEVAHQILIKNIDFNHMTLTMARMIEDGFLDVQDPFMVSLLRLWRSWTIKSLKEKAKLLVERGACLFGCVDDVGVLKGHFDRNLSKNATREQRIAALPEVFLQIAMEGQYRPLTGLCFIARNPSLHPGDIRMVKAVDRPELHHRKNVLVMPQTGDRDLGNMCSGGDLDGDDYLIVWDENLFPPMEEWNQPAMDFKGHDPVYLNRDVNVDDIGEFFIQYMKNDNLPTIAHAHLCHADKAGVKDPKCLELAQLHSHAVDYPKNGTPATMRRDLRPVQWPHFMEKAFKTPDQVYHSTGILGQLYDMIERVDFIPVTHLPFDERILSAFEIEHSLLIKAATIKRDYDAGILRIMAQLDIATEFEIFTAFAMSFNREKKEYTLAEELGNITQAHKNRFRESCIEAAGGQTYELCAPFIVAMYKVTQQQVQASRAQWADKVSTTPDAASASPLISFPWIFGKELGVIASGKFGLGEKISTSITADTPGYHVKRRGKAKKDFDLDSDFSSADFDVPLFRGPSHPAVSNIVSCSQQIAMVDSRPYTPLSMPTSDSTNGSRYTPPSSIGTCDAEIDEEEEEDEEDELVEEDSAADNPSSVARLLALM